MHVCYLSWPFARWLFNDSSTGRASNMWSIRYVMDVTLYLAHLDDACDLRSETVQCRFILPRFAQLSRGAPACSSWWLRALLRRGWAAVRFTSSRWHPQIQIQAVHCYPSFLFSSSTIPSVITANISLSTGVFSFVFSAATILSVLPRCESRTGGCTWRGSSRHTEMRSSDLQPPPSILVPCWSPCSARCEEQRWLSDGAHVEQTCVLRAWVVAYYWVSRSRKANPDLPPPRRILGTLPGPLAPSSPPRFPPRTRGRACSLLSLSLSLAVPLSLCLYFSFSLLCSVAFFFFSPSEASLRLSLHRGTIYMLHRFASPPLTITLATISSAIPSRL